MICFRDFIWNHDGGNHCIWIDCFIRSCIFRQLTRKLLCPNKCLVRRKYQITQHGDQTKVYSVIEHTETMTMLTLVSPHRFMLRGGQIVLVVGVGPHRCLFVILSPFIHPKA